MRSTFKVLFYVKKGSEKPNGNLPLMCRITVDGEVKQFSCKMDVPLHLWDVKNNRASGGYTAQRTEPDIYQRFRIFPVRKEKMSYQYRMGIYDCAETHHFHHTEHRTVAVQPFAGYINSPESVDRGYLTEEEIQTPIEAAMKNNPLWTPLADLRPQPLKRITSGK